MVCTCNLPHHPIELTSPITRSILRSHRPCNPLLRPTSNNLPSNIRISPLPSAVPNPPSPLLMNSCEARMTCIPSVKTEGLDDHPSGPSNSESAVSIRTARPEDTQLWRRMAREEYMALAAAEMFARTLAQRSISATGST